MRKQNIIIYQIVALLAAAGTIVSYLLGPGTAAPQMTIYTIAALAVLYAAECLWARAAARLKGQPTGPRWIVATLLLLAVTLVAQFVVLTLAASVWFFALPILAILVLVRLFQLPKAK